MVDTWTQPLVAEQDRRRVEAECSLHPGVLVKRGERDGEAAKPFVLQPRVDSRTSLSLVLQQIRLNLIFLGVTFDIFLWMQNLVKEMEVEAILHPVHALRTEVIVGWLERQLQLLVPSWVGSRSCPSPQCVPLDEKVGPVQEINLTWNVASRNGATWDSLGPSRTATGSTSCLTGTS